MEHTILEKGTPHVNFNRLACSYRRGSGAGLFSPCRPAARPAPGGPDHAPSGRHARRRSSALHLAGLASLLACVILACAAPAGAQNTVPDAPLMSTKPGDRKVSLHIKEPDDGGSPIIRYEYQAKVATGTYPATWTRVPDYTGNVGATLEIYVVVESLADGTVLANGTAYAFQVRAVNGVGAGMPGAEQTTPQANVPATYTIGPEQGIIARRPLAPAPRVPADQRVSLLGAIIDPDATAVADDGDDRFTYEWEWIRVTAGSETVIAGAGAANRGDRTTEYVLTPADVGSQIKARVRYRDDRYNAEEFVTALFPASGTILPAAACPAPTYTGGAAEIWSKSLTIWDIDHDEPTPNRYGVIFGTRMFTVGSNTYQIDGIYRETVGADADNLSFGLTADLTETDKNQLTLYVCDEAYPLIDATLLAQRHNYLWPSTADWSTYLTRTVYLSRDTVAPTDTGARISGTALVITFSEDLDGGSVPATTAFTVSGAANLAAGSTAVISGDTVTLTLDAAQPAGSSVTVAYTQPVADRLRDKAQNEVADFTETVTRPSQSVTSRPPGAPQNLAAATAATADGQVTLSWEAPARDGGSPITGWEYRYAEGASVPEDTAWIPVGEDLIVTPTSTGASNTRGSALIPVGETLMVTVMELTNGTEYTFELRAVSNQGGGTPASVSATPGTGAEGMPVTGPPAAIPAAPERLTAAPDDKRVTLTWRAPASDGGAAITRYEYRIDGGAWLNTGTAVTATVTDLINGRSYAFEVRAVNAAGPGEAATVTVTVGNYEPVTTAWLARFGRTVATHVTDAVGERLRAPAGQESHVTVAGYRLPLGRHAPDATQPEAEATPNRLAALVTELAGAAFGLGGASAGAGGRAPDPWMDPAAPDPRLSETRTLRLPGLRQVLMGSSFRLALGATDDAAAGAPLVTAWGRVAGTQFSGRERTVGGLDGNVLQGTVGVDGTWDRWLAGVAVAHSRGDGSFAMTGTETQGQGDLDTTLTSLHPYLHYAVTDRLAVWGMLGYGWGEVTLEQEGTAPLETDTDFLMGAVGGRGVLLAPEDTAGFELATRTDLMLMRMSGDAVAGIAEAEADAHRLRVLLEGSRPMLWPEGRRLTPTVQVGLRHDWGDAEMGFGVELGGRVQYTDPRHGLTVEAAVRGLLAHEDSDYEEWGAWGTVRVDPGAFGQGLALTVRPTWGAATSGVEGLWGRETMAGLVPQGTRPQAAGGRLNAEVSYGLAPVGTGLLTPYAGTSLADGADRLYRVGARLRLAGGTATGLELSMEGTRLEPTGPQPVNQGLRFNATWAF